MKIVSNVYETNDYSMFKTLTGNRNLNAAHIKRLSDSFKEQYLLSPIIVNENMCIIDGQHRFTVAKQMKLPIRYVVAAGYGLSEVQRLNTNTANWNAIDYMNAYCDMGNPEYIKLRNFKNMFPSFTMNSCRQILTNIARIDKQAINTTSTMKEGADKRYNTRYFERGLFVVKDYDAAVQRAHMIMAIKPYYAGYAKQFFVSAMLSVMKAEQYVHPVFIHKLSVCPTRLMDCANISSYKLIIEDIYNWASRNKVSLRF